ncbi:MAG: MarR family transcriptional regulator [Pseudomonadales bacterium]|nr:MarR family transcriptional regulator [Pseudomonadales bacterium]
METIEQVLVAIRRIIRATDLRSKQLSKQTGLTSSQLVMLKAIQAASRVTAGQLASRISLSQATVTTLLDRLEQRGLVLRQRNGDDRRKVHVVLTRAGEQTLAEAPQPLQETFVRQFRELPDWEQSMVLSSLQKVAHMMDADDLDASPMLDVGNLDRK